MKLEKIALYADLGITNYIDTFELQKRLAQKRERNEIPDVILVTEHYPIVNFGMVELYNQFSDYLYEELEKKGLKTSEKNAIKFLELRGIPFSKTQRGGGATYIGPGQINIYPIINYEEITGQSFGINRYKDMINEVMNNVIRSYNIDSQIEDQNKIRTEKKIEDERAKKGERKDIWVNIEGKNYKLGGRGIHTTGSVAYHGFNFYLNKGSTNGFKYVNPCGYTNDELGTISIEEASGKKIDVQEFKLKVLEEIKKQFGYKKIEKTINQF